MRPHESGLARARRVGWRPVQEREGAADEVLQHDAFPAMRQFNADLARDPRVVAMMVPLSYGITLCVKTVELDGGAYADAKGAGDDAVAKLLLERRAAVEQELAAME